MKHVVFYEHDFASSEMWQDLCERFGQTFYNPETKEVEYPESMAVNMRLAEGMY